MIGRLVAAAVPPPEQNALNPGEGMVPVEFLAAVEELGRGRTDALVPNEIADLAAFPSSPSPALILVGDTDAAWARSVAAQLVAVTVVADRVESEGPSREDGVRSSEDVTVEPESAAPGAHVMPVDAAQAAAAALIVAVVPPPGSSPASGGASGAAATFVPETQAPAIRAEEAKVTNVRASDAPQSASPTRVVVHAEHAGDVAGFAANGAQAQALDSLSSTTKPQAAATVMPPLPGPTGGARPPRDAADPTAFSPNEIPNAPRPLTQSASLADLLTRVTAAPLPEATSGGAVPVDVGPAMEAPFVGALAADAIIRESDGAAGADAFSAASVATPDGLGAPARVILGDGVERPQLGGTPADATSAMARSIPSRERAEPALAPVSVEDDALRPGSDAARATVQRSPAADAPWRAHGETHDSDRDRPDDDVDPGAATSRDDPRALRLADATRIFEATARGAGDEAPTSGPAPQRSAVDDPDRRAAYESNGHLRLDVRTPDLGDVWVRLRSRGNEVAAVVTTESAATGRAIAAEAGGLQAALASQGVALAGMDVNGSPARFTAQHDDGNDREPWTGAPRPSSGTAARTIAAPAGATGLDYRV